MIVTKRAIPRRTFLRGAGVTLALPLLDAMVPALTAVARTAAAPVRRLGFIYLPNGVGMNAEVNYWKPSGEGADFELSRILAPLEPFRDRLAVVSGLVHEQAQPHGDGNGDHTRATATWLNGVHPNKTEGADIRAGVTVDQIAAKQFAAETQLPSLEYIASDVDALGGQCENSYSCAYLNTIAWSTATTSLPMENDPRVVFERLFGDGGTAEQRSARLRRTRSILDWVHLEVAALQRQLGAGDRARVEEYVDTVREVERRIQRAEAQHAETPLPLTLDRPVGIPTRFDEHVRLMFDLQVLAFQADITRVFTFMFGRELNNRAYPEIGINDPHHGLSHHGNRPGRIELYAKLNTYQTEQFAYFLEKMRSTPEGDGTLLDRSLVLYGSGLSNGNEHSHVDMGLVVAGGGITGGRHVAHPLEREVPMTNLLVTMLEKAGVNIDQLGDSNGTIDL